VNGSRRNTAVCVERHALCLEHLRPHVRSHRITDWGPPAGWAGAGRWDLALAQHVGLGLAPLPAEPPEPARGGDDALSRHLPPPPAPAATAH
jgi:hypothetical protein